MQTFWEIFISGCTIKKIRHIWATFFTDHPYIYRSQMEQLCECSKHLALKYLNELVDEGYLHTLGRKNSRFYAPRPEGF